MGDKRRTARLVRSAAWLAEYPGRALNANARSDAAAVDGYYRLSEQPDGWAVTVGGDLGATSRAQRTVLCIPNAALAPITA